MARPLRLELSGALYLVTSHAVAGERLFLNVTDRRAWLDALAHVCARFKWVCHGYCQLNDHFELLIETSEANLSMGMRQLGAVYTQNFNRRHGREGAVVQGRFKAILVDKETHLLAVARHVVQSPSRLKPARGIDTWPWSSYPATCGQTEAPAWLHSQSILAALAPQRARAIAKYLSYMADTKGAEDVLSEVRGAIFLGSDGFVQKMQVELAKKAKQPTVAVSPRGLRAELKGFATAHPRDDAMTRAFSTGRHTMTAIAAYFDVTLGTVSRVVRKNETG